MQSIPENVRHLKPVEVVEYQPSNVEIMGKLIEIQAQVAAMYALTVENRADIEASKTAMSFIVDQVKPTLDMLSNGPIGQLLGIAPPPVRRNRRG
jgi:hypothetical protein